MTLRNPPLAALLAWFIPGAGHLYQGRRGKALLFLLCVGGLYGFGLWLGASKSSAAEPPREGRPALGAPIQDERGAEDELKVDYRLRMDQVVYFRWDNKEWSWSYLAQLGVGIAALPALRRDTTNERWDRQLDEFHREKGRDIDLARLLTIVAGLLNMLVIYDAFAGPAMADEEQKILAEKKANATPGEKP